ncbi:hypothetical protein [Pararhizobium sp. DWP1-1-3]|uniref:hypothetical protein n=1 Tax=Pararhizobium sp. DWP1-1-3 TaxID=2804652 RepID=UPI003CF8C749
MPYVKPEISPATEVMVRVASTFWLNHLACGVRSCRRDCRYLARKTRFGHILCVAQMEDREITEMLDFCCDTVELATPQQVAAGLAGAKTDDEREMILFRRQIFLYFHAELAKAGLIEPLGPPFVEG